MSGFTVSSGNNGVRSRRRRVVLRFLNAFLMLVPVVLAFVAYSTLPGFRAELNGVGGMLLREDYDGVRDYVLGFGSWAPVVSLTMMILQAIIAPVPAFAISVANGLIFGVFWGFVWSMVGRALSASFCFYVCRLVGRDVIESLVGEKALERSSGWLERWGVQAVLVTRLLPFFSFDLVSYAAGVTRIRYRHFLMATVIGEVPAVLVYSWVGARAPEFMWVLFAANLVLFVAALVFGFLYNRRRRRRRIESPDGPRL